MSTIFLSWTDSSFLDSVKEAEHCLEVCHPDRPLLVKDNYMYLISPSAEKIQNLYAAVSAVTLSVAQDPRVLLFFHSMN